MRLMPIAIAVLIAVAGSRWAHAAPDAASQPKYTEPKVELLEINAKSLQLPDTDRKKTAGDLVACLCKAPAATQPFYDQATRVLAMALLLDPESRVAVLANGRLRSGRLPDAVAGSVTPDALAVTLRAQATALLKPISRDCARMAGYLLMLANELSPRNDEILYDLEMFRKKGLDLRWESLFEPPPAARLAGAAMSPAAPPSTVKTSDALVPGAVPGYDKRSKPFAKTQASVKGLFIRTLPTVGQTGMVLDIIATVFTHSDPYKVSAEFAIPVGEEMSVSWDEALRVLQTRYPHWEPGKRLSFSFSDKYSPKDGGSAGVAFCMLLWSLLDGVELDPNCSVTGDVTVDWKVRPVGGIGAKIRGATLDKSLYVLIPKSNERQLEDAVLINSASILWQIQVLTIDDISEASAMIRKDRSAEATEALKLFANLQARAKASGSAAFRTPEAQQALRTVCQKLPNHASARLILKGLSNQLQSKLTLAATVEETMVTMIPAFPFLMAKTAEDKNSALLGSGDALATARKRLERLHAIADEKGKPLELACQQCLKAAEEYKAASERISKSQRPTETAQHLLQTKGAALMKACEALDSAFRALQTDKSAIETLTRQ